MRPLKITINNKNNSCAALAGAIVDNWHCDADGNYSEYGGSGMQSINYTSVHFLRGRQTTDASGVVTFNTIFPGWYGGRAPHIHVHVYSPDGASLMITQLPFLQMFVIRFIQLPQTITKKESRIQQMQETMCLPTHEQANWLPLQAVYLQVIPLHILLLWLHNYKCFI